MTTTSATELRGKIEDRLTYSIGKEPATATLYDWRMALSMALRDLVVEPWFASTRRSRVEQRKRVYYLSVEFLIGRLVQDAAINLGVEEEASAAMAALGQDYAKVVTDEPDAALGNGGLGRLAACFLDSLSTLGIAAHGYGIRYEHGLFRQGFESGQQVESPEEWLLQRPAWEFPRLERSYRIGFGGEVRGDGARVEWEPEDTVLAVAHDTPIVGWRAQWVNTLRLWSARPTKVFDLERFNRGEYLAASEPEALARTISRVLYPDDTTEPGRELRLKQEYFFAAASVRDLMGRFLSQYDDLRLLPRKVAIQLNDTHPAVAGPELVRLLADQHGFELTDAIETAQRCLSYTNHTLMPEALEQWPVDLFRRVLPRHYQIIERIDDWHHRKLKGREKTVHVIDHGQIRMGALSFVTAHHVNGVSELHTDLMRQTVFADLSRLHPKRIVNQTNGVTPRRWLYNCNPHLRLLITNTIGPDWPTDTGQLAQLEPYLQDAAFLDDFAAAKWANKLRLAEWLHENHGVTVDPSALFDVQIKRLHEYKRQLMNLLETVALWNAMHAKPNADWTPRVKIFGGKAAPGYAVAKQIIRLINDVGRVINADPVTREKLQIVFPANYNVSMAEILIPAADLSEQISTAGTEASGTGNMKLMMNGAPTIGTFDGANIEIRERVGADNFFLFGMNAAEVAKCRGEPGHARRAIDASPALTEVLGQINGGRFSPDEPGRYQSLVAGLYEHDYFLVTGDFDAYYAAQRKVDAAFRDARHWTRLGATNTARSGWFSSDRTIEGYAKEIWGVPPLERGESKDS
jgi:starch phosphorylase